MHRRNPLDGAPQVWTLFEEFKKQSVWGHMIKSINRSTARVAQLIAVVLAFAGGAAFAQSSSPPAVGTGGTTGVLAGDPWTVCRADTNTAWLAANTGGTYNAVEACESVGYSSVTNQGGTCGDVCGYCGNAGQETYDGGGGSVTSLSNTVHWECSDFVQEEEEEESQKIDTTKAAQEARARFGLNRASSLLSNQPDLIPFLSGGGGLVSMQMSLVASELWTSQATQTSRFGLRSQQAGQTSMGRREHMLWGQLARIFL